MLRVQVADGILQDKINRVQDVQAA